MIEVFDIKKEKITTFLFILKVPHPERWRKEFAKFESGVQSQRWQSISCQWNHRTNSHRTQWRIFALGRNEAKSRNGCQERTSVENCVIFYINLFTTNGEDTDIMALEGDDINHNLSNKIESIKNVSESVYQ